MSDKKKSSARVTIDEPEQGTIRGKLTLDERVVETIAGLAAKRIAGINRLGKSRLITFNNNPHRGVSAEVGSKQAALDLDVVIDYGVDIRKVASEVRRMIAIEVAKMAGREVIEVNLNIVDIKLPQPIAEEVVEPSPRVQ